MIRTNKYVGSPIERIEDLRFLKGRGEYVDDLTRPDLLHAVILRSSIAHGVIRSIDVSAALAMPGIHAVITAEDIGATELKIPLRQDIMPGLERFEQPVIAFSKVRHVGEPIAIVVADSPALAEDGLEAIALDIEVLPAVADRDASRTDATLLFDAAGTNLAGQFTAVLGDLGRIFETAPYTRRESFTIHRHTGVPMESRGLLAEWDSNGHLIISGASKVTFANRRMLAALMDIPVDSIRMVENDVGGGFGVRGEFYPEDFLIPFVARKVGRPVKWIEDRREHLIGCCHARDAECELEIACERDGTILALRGVASTDVGAYVRTIGPTASRNIAQVMSGPYRIPNLKIDVSMQLTNKTPVGTYRGPGRYEADFFRERLLDLVAEDLGLDRVAFRRHNLVSEAEMPYRLARVVQLGLESECDSGDYQQTLDRCLNEIDWDGKAELNGKLIDGRYHGLAIGCYIEGGASGPRENARLVLEDDGSVSVYVGSSSVGQGIETVFAQIAADHLEMSIDNIRGVFHGSTDFVSEGFGSYSSRSVVMGGSAIVDAAVKLREIIRTKAAERLHCQPSEIEIGSGKVVGPGGASISLGALASDGVACEGTFASNKRTYSYGAHAAHITVDPKTGCIAILDYVAVEDVGRIINPMTLHGQAVGAVLQGLGGVLLEHLVYDADAQLMTGSLADYLMPTASDFPNIRAVTLELKPSPNNPLGAKGAGEGGIISVAGVITNAVAAALSSLGVKPCDLPLSPARVWQLIEDARGRGQAVPLMNASAG